MAQYFAEVRSGQDGRLLYKTPRSYPTRAAAARDAFAARPNAQTCITFTGHGDDIQAHHRDE